MRATNWHRKKAGPNGKGGEKPQKQERTEEGEENKNESERERERVFLRFSKVSSEETEIFIHKVKRPFSLLFNRLHKLMNGEDFFFQI